MKTLKKTLGLILVIAMCFSLLSMGASAVSFNDADDINEDFSTAVSAMNDLGIIAGYDDGSFQPQTVLTREQAAKIIAYLMIGSNAADGLTTSSAPFTDVEASRWSAGYIAYCVSEGIVNGLGDGTFNPTGELTGYAFAKMLLVALGPRTRSKQESLTAFSAPISLPARPVKKPASTPTTPSLSRP
jgi:hypothetical protein